MLQFEIKNGMKINSNVSFLWQTILPLYSQIYYCNKHTGKLIFQSKKKVFEKKLLFEREVVGETEVTCWWGVCVAAPSFSPGAQLGHHSPDRCRSGLHCAPEPHAADDSRCISRPAHPGHPAGSHQCPGHPARTHQCPGHPASAHRDTRTPPCCTHGHAGAAASTHWCPAAPRRHQDLR